MKELFHCLGLFVGWLQGGLYDFSSLPMSVFSHLAHGDEHIIMEAYTEYSRKIFVVQLSNKLLLLYLNVKFKKTGFILHAYLINKYCVFTHVIVVA